MRVATIRETVAVDPITADLSAILRLPEQAHEFDVPVVAERHLDDYPVTGRITSIGPGDRAVGAQRTSEGIAPQEADGLRGLYDRLRASRPAKVDGWEWFEPTERHLRELRCEVAQALAKRALERSHAIEAVPPVGSTRSRRPAAVSMR